MLNQLEVSENNQQILDQISGFRNKYGRVGDMRQVNGMTEHAVQTLKRQRDLYIKRMKHVGYVSWNHLLEGSDRGLFNMVDIDAQGRRNEVAKRLILSGIELVELVDATITSSRDEFIGYHHGIEVDIESANPVVLHNVRTI